MLNFIFGAKTWNAHWTIPTKGPVPLNRFWHPLGVDHLNSSASLPALVTHLYAPTHSTVWATCFVLLAHESTIKLHRCISLSTNVSCRKEAPRLTPGHVSHRSLNQIRNHRFSGQGTYSPKSLPFSYSAPGCLCLICLSATSWSLLCVLTVANYLSLPPPLPCLFSQLAPVSNHRLFSIRIKPLHSLISFPPQTQIPLRYTALPWMA